MLMKPEKKKNMAALIIGASAPKPPMDDAKTAASDMTQKPQMDHGLLSAADEMMQALHAKDVHGFAEALKAFMEMADQDESEPSEEPPQE